jgi:hypothetical protein
MARLADDFFQKDRLANIRGPTTHSNLLPIL